MTLARLKFKEDFQVKEVETYFGRIILEAARVIYFPNAILGFSEFHNYCIATIPDNKVPGSLILQSIEDEKLAFIVTPLGDDLFDKNNPVLDYEEIEAAASLYNIEETNLSCVAITKLSKLEGEIIKTANLMAPLLLDMREQVGYQHVFLKNNYPINYIIK
ncbi:MAG: hypothetical protein EB127_07040 [Alphaproteobacteria bacterium]|nr:hypothetical protein [Alphaproteobacteria bacterium]